MTPFLLLLAASWCLRAANCVLMAAPQILQKCGKLITRLCINTCWVVCLAGGGDGGWRVWIDEKIDMQGTRWQTQQTSQQYNTQIYATNATDTDRRTETQRWRKIQWQTYRETGTKTEKPRDTEIVKDINRDRDTTSYGLTIISNHALRKVGE